MGTKFQFGKTEGMMEMDGDDGHITVRLYLIPLNCTCEKNGYDGKFYVMCIAPQ